MAHGFRKRSGQYVGSLDRDERTVVIGLLKQTRELLSPGDETVTGDAFTDLMASLGPLDIPSDGRSSSVSAGAPQASQSSSEPADPALTRLLPDGHRADPEVAADFRRLTEFELRRRKTANLTVAIDALLLIEPGSDDLRLDEASATAMLVALTDTRLLLAERLGLHTEDDVDALESYAAHVPDDDVVAHFAAIYDFMTWFQESLSLAMLRR